MAFKSTIDLVSLGLILISLYLLLGLINIENTFSQVVGFIGTILLILVEIVFLYERWVVRRRK